MSPQSEEQEAAVKGPQHRAIGSAFRALLAVLWIVLLYRRLASISAYFGSAGLIGEEGLLFLPWMAALVTPISGLCSVLLFRFFPTVSLITGAYALLSQGHCI